MVSFSSIKGQLSDFTHVNTWLHLMNVAQWWHLCYLCLKAILSSQMAWGRIPVTICSDTVQEASLSWSSISSQLWHDATPSSACWPTGLFTTLANYWTFYHYAWLIHRFMVMNGAYWPWCFTLAPPWVSFFFGFLVTCLSSYGIDCHYIWSHMTPLRMNSTNFADPWTSTIRSKFYVMPPILLMTKYLQN